MSSKQRLVDGYVDWMESLHAEEFEPYLLTFMFHHIPGSALSVQRVMTGVIEQVYSRSLTRLLRFPNSLNNRPIHPRWIVCPDYPVGKNCVRSPLREVNINEGRHAHAIAMVFPEHRLRDRFDLHLLCNDRTYLVAPLRRLHALPIRDELAKTTRYALKQLTRGRVDTDQLLGPVRSWYERLSGVHDPG